MSEIDWSNAMMLASLSAAVTPATLTEFRSEYGPHTWSRLSEVLQQPHSTRQTYETLLEVLKRSSTELMSVRASRLTGSDRVRHAVANQALGWLSDHDCLTPDEFENRHPLLVGCLRAMNARLENHVFGVLFDVVERAVLHQAHMLRATDAQETLLEVSLGKLLGRIRTDPYDETQAQASTYIHRCVHYARLQLYDRERTHLKHVTLAHEALPDLSVEPFEAVEWRAIFGDLTQYWDTTEERRQTAERSFLCWRELRELGRKGGVVAEELNVSRITVVSNARDIQVCIQESYSAAFKEIEALPKPLQEELVRWMAECVGKQYGRLDGRPPVETASF